MYDGGAAAIDEIVPTPLMWMATSYTRTIMPKSAVHLELFVQLSFGLRS